MPALSHRLAALSIGLAALGLALPAAAAPARPYWGRWTVAEDNPVFSSRGREYKTIDIAPCGKDFCGVSVAADGSCGPTLFRFLTIHASNEELKGHVKWGNAKKTVVIDYVKNDVEPPYVMLGIGEPDLDFSSREGSMPIFSANYTVKGEAHCFAK